jgi:succinylglutamate desuccinylase
MAYPAPIRADHRYVVQMLNTVFKGDRTSPSKAEVEILCEVFAKAGGSWERLFQGSAEDENLLRRVARVAIQRGLLTRQSTWE